jgi:hypothetical protein
MMGTIVEGLNRKLIMISWVGSWFCAFDLRRGDQSSFMHECMNADALAIHHFMTLARSHAPRPTNDRMGFHDIGGN